jgi:hypothetical protein
MSNHTKAGRRRSRRMHDERVRLPVMTVMVPVGCAWLLAGDHFSVGDFVVVDTDGMARRPPAPAAMRAEVDRLVAESFGADVTPPALAFDVRPARTT